MRRLAGRTGSRSYQRTMGTSRFTILRGPNTAAGLATLSNQRELGCPAFSMLCHFRKVLNVFGRSDISSHLKLAYMHPESLYDILLIVAAIRAATGPNDIYS